MTPSSSNSKWFTIPKPNPHAGLRLFCFPYAGGGAMIYRAWPDSLPPTFEVVTARLPGREDRINELPFDRIEPIVQTLAAAILPFLDRPFAFFGHSMGALIGFELARRLRHEARPQPVRLFVSACRAPQVARGDRRITYNLPEPEFIEEVGRLKGTPMEVFESPELAELVIHLLRADFSVVQTYSYTPDAPFDFPLTVFGGVQDERVTRDELESWREQTTAPSSVRMMPGDHFFINTNRLPLLRTVAQELQQSMAVTT